MSKTPSNKDVQKLDWVHLPSGHVAQSLWAPLHDGELLAVRSDSFHRSVVLEIDVPHIRAFHGLADDTRFVLAFHHVESARVSAFVAWLGSVPEYADVSREEQTRLINEHQAKGREESFRWSDFVAAFPTNVLDIYSAEVTREENTAAIQIVGLLTGDEFDDRYVTLFLRAKNMLIRQSNDDVALSLEQFIQLGASYWIAWDQTR